MAAALLAASFPLTTTAALAATTPHISEIHYDNVGSDIGEFFEITADAGTDLSGWSVALYDGATGATKRTVALSGVIPDEAGGLGALAFFPRRLEDGAPDGLALLNGAAVVEFISYEGSFTATNGAASGLTSADIGVSETSSTAVGQSLQIVAGVWTGPAAESPGTLNDPSDPPPPGDFDLISSIQGSGSASPMQGQTVTLQAVVVGDFQSITTDDSGDEDLGGFFVQEEDVDTDADPASSEGLFVFDPGGTAVSVGDLIEVTGVVSELSELTQISLPSAVTVVSSANPLPTPATPTVPTSVGDPVVDWEALEGMGVSFTQTLHVTGLFPMGSFGEVQLSAIGAQDHPNQTNAVGSTAASDQAQLNQDARVILDDGEYENETFPAGLDTWNPTPTPYLIAPDNTLRSGDTVTNLLGVVHYSHGEFEIHPVNLADPNDPDGGVNVNRIQARPGVPVVGGNLRVASFNVLNYFTTIDSGGALCGPPGNQQGCRGADTTAEFATQSAKIVNALIDLDADIVGLVELENNADVAIADLANRLNTEPGATRGYAYIATGYVGTDAITGGIIYDPATVVPTGGFAVLDSSVSAAFIDTSNRPAIAQTFTEIASGGTITIAVNHLKSKGSACDSISNPGDAAFGVVGYGSDPLDPNFQGNCNLTRTAAAQVLGQWLAGNPTGTASDNLLILGDLNAYANEDPITSLEAQGYEDLNETYSGGNSWAVGGHSYVFDGEHGTLDYALANAALAVQVTGVGAWHINADEPFAIDYQNFNPPGQVTLDEFKSSDHDPILVGIDLDGGGPPPPPPPGDLCNGLTPTITGSGTIEGTSGDDVILGSAGADTIIAGDGNDTVCGEGGADLIRGGTGSDTLFGGDGDDALYGQNDNDILDGGPGNDFVDGGGGRQDVCVNGETVVRCEL